MKRKTYSCPITKYRVEYIISSTKDIALLNIIESDYKNMKALLALLRSSIDILKTKNIKYIMQCVEEKEWLEYLNGKTSWVINNSNELEQTHMLKCDIDDFLENFGVGIGL